MYSIVHVDGHLRLRSTLALRAAMDIDYHRYGCLDSRILGRYILNRVVSGGQTSD